LQRSARSRYGGTQVLVVQLDEQLATTHALSLVH
jgi:hypothetical protein